MTRTRLSDALWLIALALLFVTLLVMAVAANDVLEQDSGDWYRPVDATVVVEVGR